MCLKCFNQEKALVGAFSVIVQLHRLIDLRHNSPRSSRRQQKTSGPIITTGDTRHILTMATHNISTESAFPY